MKYVSVMLSKSDINLLLSLLEVKRHNSLTAYLNSRKIGVNNAEVYDMQEHCENLIDDLQIKMEALENGQVQDCHGSGKYHSGRE